MDHQQELRRSIAVLLKSGSYPLAFTMYKTITKDFKSFFDVAMSIFLEQASCFMEVYACTTKTRFCQDQFFEMRHGDMSINFYYESAVRKGGIYQVCIEYQVSLDNVAMLTSSFVYGSDNYQVRLQEVFKMFVPHFKQSNQILYFKRLVMGQEVYDTKEENDLFETINAGDYE